MKPSIQKIKEKMGPGYAHSKTEVTKEIQRLIKDPNEDERRPKIAALLWVFTGEDCNDAAIDLIYVFGLIFN